MTEPYEPVVEHVVEHVTGVIAVDLPDGGIRLERWDATIIGPRSITRPHARIPAPEVPLMVQLDSITTRRAVPELRRQLLVAYVDHMHELVAGIVTVLSVMADAEDTAHLTRAAGIRDRHTLPEGAERQARTLLGLQANRILGPADYYRVTVNTATGEIRVHVPDVGPEHAYGPDASPVAGRLVRAHVAPWHDSEGGLERAEETLRRDWQLHDDFTTPDGGTVWESIVVPTDLDAVAAASVDDMPAR